MLDHPFIETPNIDKLASNGVYFDEAFVTTSLCSPSMASNKQFLHHSEVMVLDKDQPTIIKSRNRGSGCPVCANFKTVKSNCLASVYPELALEWHSSRNNSLTPNDVTPSSTKKVWWKGKCGHEWEAVISKRAYRGHGCPECRGKKISQTRRRISQTKP